MKRKILHLIDLPDGVQVLLRRQDDEDGKPMVKITFVKDCEDFIIDGSVSPVFEHKHNRDSSWDDLLSRDIDFWQNFSKNTLSNFV